MCRAVSFFVIAIAAILWVITSASSVMIIQYTQLVY